jgi:hypothetical protein
MEPQMATTAPEGLKKFAAQVSYTAHSGYSSTSSFRGDDKSADPRDAFVCVLHELAMVAVRAGWEEVATNALAERIADVRAAMATVA